MPLIFSPESKLLPEEDDFVLFVSGSPAKFEAWAGPEEALPQEELAPQEKLAPVQQESSGSLANPEDREKKI